MLKSIRRTRLYEEIVAQLRNLIREGTLRPGDRLPPERELAEQFRVSRGSVREALRALEIQGLIQGRPGAGTFVVADHPEAIVHALAQHLMEGRENLQDVLELRFILEPHLASLAAERATEEDIQDMNAALKEQAQEIAQEHSGAPQDESFHFALAHATHNRALLHLSSALREILSLSRDESLQSPERSRQSLVSHQQILEAVRRRDPSGAGLAMHEHISTVHREVEQEPARTPMKG